ncbi:MAG: hypothetical protein PVI60_05890 [Desulfobacteraceae bacterium]
MNESIKKRWMPVMGVFLSIFGSFAALMYISVTTFQEGPNRSGTSFFRFHQSGRQTVGVPNTRLDTNSPLSNSSNNPRIVLEINRDHAVGKSILTYRGLEGRSKFRLDVVVPELDAQYTYLHKFDIDQARKGFQVGGEHLRLISAGRSNIRIWRQIPRR